MLDQAVDHRGSNDLVAVHFPPQTSATSSRSRSPRVFKVLLCQSLRAGHRLLGPSLPSVQTLARTSRGRYPKRLVSPNWPRRGPSRVTTPPSRVDAVRRRVASDHASAISGQSPWHRAHRVQLMGARPGEQSSAADQIRSLGLCPSVVDDAPDPGAGGAVGRSCAVLGSTSRRLVKCSSVKPGSTSMAMRWLAAAILA
jgi:hypothetical protein